MSNREFTAVLRDDAMGNWRCFRAPARVLATHRLDEVLPLLNEIEGRVERDGLHAAGFVSYEAAPAFDPALPRRPDPAFPLLWFGLFPEVHHSPALPQEARDTSPLRWQPDITPAHYRRCLDMIREFIGAGDTYQVNFTYRLRAETGSRPWDLFTHLIGETPPPYAAFIDAGEWSVCGASPELFLRRDGVHVESRPMKGTAARGLWYEDDQEQAQALKASEKERAENVMIVDMVRNDLGRIADTGSVRVPALFSVERYPSVWQMTSTVEADTGASLTRIFQACFPPASITGAPKRRTMEIIAALESSPRRVYTGAAGFLAPGRRAQFNVAIRTALLQTPTGHVEYGVGGGIVWDSRPDAELDESRAKARILGRRIPRFELLETMLWEPDTGCARLEYHLKRLARSAEYFGYRHEPGEVHNALDQATAGLPRMPHRIRLLLSRSGAAQCQVRALDPFRIPFAGMRLAAAPIDRNEPFLYHKTTHRAVYEEALRQRPESEDVLLFNEDGEVTESTIANVAFEFDGALYTPPVRCGLLPGTCRAALLDSGRLQERTVTVGEALRCKKVYLMNAVRGLQPVTLRA